MTEPAASSARAISRFIGADFTAPAVARLVHCENRGEGKASPDGGPVKLIGIVLIVFGLVALAAGGFSYTKREKAIDLGPVEVTTAQQRTIPVSASVGVVAVAAGVVLVATGSRTRV